MRGGMVIRLQGFGEGIFGENFHTHNSLALCPPGMDLVCFSNGTDGVRGLRHALWQARDGRVVVLVDGTQLLTTKHVHESEKEGPCLGISIPPIDAGCQR